MASDFLECGLSPLQYEYIEKIKSLNSTRSEKLGRPITCLTHTYGCQQNENDTEKINGMLELMGFVFTEDRSKADFILFNTCAVREHAEQKVFGNVGALVQYKKGNPELRIALCGCMFQQKHAAEKVAGYRYVDMIFGTHAITRFPENMYRMLAEGKKVYDIAQTESLPPEDMPVKRGDTLKAWVTVMAGCNNFCSYCVVPYVRGREHSRKPEKVIAEVKKLIADGYKDITLLGQNVNSYCKDLSLDYDFSDLLRDINALDGDFRIRFMTSHPKDATKKLFDTVATCEKVCKHIHLPFQSGSDRILKLMNRRYTAKQYLELIEYGRRMIPDVSFTSDVIVGFPTETEEDFEDTLSLIRAVGFNGLFTFQYSPRKNTPAAVMEGQISKEVKGERFSRLLALQSSKSFDFHSKYKGRTVRVLAENALETPGMYTGRTDNNIIVNFSSQKDVTASFVAVTIDEAKNWALLGHVAESSQLK